MKFLRPILVALRLVACSMSAEAGIHADFHTSAGDFSILLHHQASPRTVANFIGLAEGTRAWIHPGTGAVVSGKPFYNGLVFHRVIAGTKAVVRSAMEAPDQATLSATNFPRA